MLLRNAYTAISSEKSWVVMLHVRNSACASWTLILRYLLAVNSARADYVYIAVRYSIGFFFCDILRANTLLEIIQLWHKPICHINRLICHTRRLQMSTGRRSSGLTATAGASPVTLSVMGYHAAWVNATPIVQQQHTVSFEIQCSSIGAMCWNSKTTILQKNGRLLELPWCVLRLTSFLSFILLTSFAYLSCCRVLLVASSSLHCLDVTNAVLWRRFLCCLDQA